MSKKIWETILVILVGLAAAGAPWPAPPVQAQAPGPNLLVDGDFEAPPTWPMQDGIGEVQVAPGWRAWYLDNPPPYVVPPPSCYGQNGGLKDQGCYWMRPEFRDNTAFENRIYSGSRSQKYFSFGRMHEAGLMQRVSGLRPGAVLRFSIYIQAWMCYDIDKCGKKGEKSDAPSTMHLRVGIDPYGGTNPFSPSIVWGPEMDAFDRWVEFSVQATAQSDAVTVFTHSRPEWDWARKQNDVYLDNASLVQIGGPGAPPPQPTEPPPPTPQPEPPTAAPPAEPPTATNTPGPTRTPAPTRTPGPTRTPAPTRTPRPDNAVVHVVQPGDTLFAIALQYDVPVEDIYRLNDMTNTSVLEIGQEIIVKAGATPAPAPAPSATPTLPPPTPTAPQPTATSTQGALCLGAFEDANENALRDGSEPGLAGVSLIVAPAGGASEVATQYTTEGSTQLHCLVLPPGAYIIQVKPPSGYEAAYDETGVDLAAGQRVQVDVPVRRSVSQGRPPSPTAGPGQAPGLGEGSWLSLLGSAALALGGVMILVGVVVTLATRRKS